MEKRNKERQNVGGDVGQYADVKTNVDREEKFKLEKKLNKLVLRKLMNLRT
jgi:hypothetical protein